MEVVEITGAGAADLGPEVFIAALEQVIVRLGYVLEWRPGANKRKLHVFWRSF